MTPKKYYLKIRKETLNIKEILTTEEWKSFWRNIWSQKKSYNKKQCPLKIHDIKIIIIIMSRNQYKYPWSFLPTPPYRPLLPAGLQDYIP